MLRRPGVCAPMTKSFHILAVASATLLSLSGCQQKAPDVVGGVQPDAVAIAAANKAPVTLPPAILSTKTYRCKDKSAIQVNFLADNVTANVRPAEAATTAPTTLTAPAAGEPFVAEGYSLSSNSDTMTYTAPGRPSQECKA